MRFNADKIYFDELVAGVSTGINFDDAKNFDADLSNQIAIALDLTLAVQKSRAIEILDIDIECEPTFLEDYSAYVDLLQLVPTKFRSSQLLIDYLREAGVLVGTWLGDINALPLLIDKYSVGDDYIQKLADLVNLTIISDETTSLAEKRRQLIQVIEWYKMKGTYRALQFIGYLLGMDLNFWDLYTTNYSTFTRTAWYAGDLGTNPPGLSSSYYKSPHLGIEVVLDKVYGSNPDTYLFRNPAFTNLTTYVEKVRPINVVPHYNTFLAPQCDQSGNVMSVAGNIRTCVIGTWSFSRLYFDNRAPANVIDLSSNNVVDDTSSQVEVDTTSEIYFNDGKFFDYQQTAFYNTITRWKIGTGNKNTSPASSGWTLQNIVLSGLIGQTTIYSDRVEYEFEVPNTFVQTGVSELGLYLATGDFLEVGATFPDVDLISGISLRVVVTVYRT